MKKLITRAVLALALIAGFGPVIAQQFPTVPAQSVIGRMGTPGDTGPSQAIPFATLSAQLLGGAQNPNLVYSGPTSGSPHSPTFRALVGADIPPINLGTSGNGGVTGSAATAQGGTGANNSTNSAGDVLASNGANGTFVHTALNTLCSAIPSICAKVVGRASIAWYGAVCDGTTDDTTAIQNAWNAAQSLSVNVWLGGIGPSCKITTITMPTPIAIGNSGGFNPARSAMLKGPGAAQVTLLSSVTSTNCAIVISATYGVNGTLEGSFSGFGVRQSANAKAGVGICATGISKATFDDVSVVQFNVGFQGVDAILINIAHCYFSVNTTHISGVIGTNSDPNAWNITDSHFDSSVNVAINLARPTLVNIRGNDFESNGTLGTSAATIFVTHPPAIGTGLNIEGNYFEGNQGIEIAISQNAGTIKSVYNIFHNMFLRSLTNNVAGVLLTNNGTGAAFTNINVGGNVFYDNTGAGSFNFLGTSAGTANYLYKCSAEPNITSPTAEINAACVIATTGFN